MTCMDDHVVILQGEIGCWSLLDLKGLKIIDLFSLFSLAWSVHVYEDVVHKMNCFGGWKTIRFAWETVKKESSAVFSCNVLLFLVEAIKILDCCFLFHRSQELFQVVKTCLSHWYFLINMLGQNSQMKSKSAGRLLNSCLQKHKVVNYQWKKHNHKFSYALPFNGEPQYKESMIRWTLSLHSSSAYASI